MNQIYNFSEDMIIKEVEEILKIQRATIRYYEKEGLIVPNREKNGYRVYNEADIIKLKQIIIFRKLGFSIEDIKNIYLGVYNLSEIADKNIAILHNQIMEFKGAINICNQIKEKKETKDSFDADEYWNTINEEEEKGNKFFGITKDIIGFEKETFFEYIGVESKNKSSKKTGRHILFRIILISIISGFLMCIYKRSLTINYFLYGVSGFFITLILGSVLVIPLYFLGNKYRVIKINKVTIIGLIIVIISLLIIFLNL